MRKKKISPEYIFRDDSVFSRNFLERKVELPPSWFKLMIQRDLLKYNQRRDIQRDQEDYLKLRKILEDNSSELEEDNLNYDR